MAGGAFALLTCPARVLERAHCTRDLVRVLWHFQNSENATVERMRFVDDGLGSKDESLRPSVRAQILSALSRFAA